MERPEIIAISQCSKGKRIAINDLNLARLPGNCTIEEGSQVWASWVRDSCSEVPAQQLYKGRGVKEFNQCGGSLVKEKYIVSAGLGLIDFRRSIPTYEATVTGPGLNAISRRWTIKHVPTWWKLLNSNLYESRYPITDLIRRNPNAILILALSKPYLLLVSDDLNKLTSAETERIRIIGPQDISSISNPLRECVLPYDHRFDSPHPGGTRTDFPQRALRHYIELMKPTRNLKADRERIEKLLKQRPKAPKIPERRRLGDEQILQLLKIHWKENEGKTGRLLRLFRDRLLVSCEQRRFSNLVNSIRNEK